MPGSSLFLLLLSLARVSSLTLCSCVLSRLAAAAGCHRWNPAGNGAPRMQPDGSDGRSATRDIRGTEAQRLRHLRKYARRCPALFRLVSGRKSRCLRMHARRASAAFTCWEMATGLFASRIRDDRTPGNGLVRCLVPVVPAQYYKWAKWTSIRDAFLFEWKSEQLLCTLPAFPVFNLWRYLVATLYRWDAIFILSRNNKAINVNFY